MTPLKLGLRQPTKDEIGAQLEAIGMSNIASGFLVQEKDASGRNYSDVKYWGTSEKGHGMAGELMVPWAKK